MNFDRELFNEISGWYINTGESYLYECLQTLPLQCAIHECVAHFFFCGRWLGIQNFACVEEHVWDHCTEDFKRFIL